ncbi:MAG TPA: FtsQ-type POTRA domain-containing protein [Thermoanaerobaculia bacterium]|nr:FtsQ-type POTRA domain-containing protein [Thermoanaerobaculia bacterium]
MTSFESADRFLRPSDLRALRRNHRQLQMQRILVVAANLVVAFLFFLGTFWLYRMTQANRRFAIRSVEVTGYVHTTKGSLDAIVAQHVGENLFRIDIAALNHQFASLPWVEQVAIEKQLPNTLRVRIRERQPVAIVAGDSLRFVDQSGVVFAPVSRDAGPAALPVISDAQTADSVSRTVDFLREVRTKNPALYSRLSEISPVAENGFRIFDRDLRTEVLLSREDGMEKWSTLYAIAQGEGYGTSSIEYADLRFTGRIVIRPRKPAASVSAAPVVPGLIVSN